MPGPLFRQAMARGEPSSPAERAERIGGGRPLAKLGCALRGGHAYMASRRIEGFDTCIRCGTRRKAPEGPWFATPAPRPSSRADVDPGPVLAPDSAEGPLPLSGKAPGDPSGPPNGVDPRVLRDFLKQIDSGGLNAKPGSGRGGRGPKPPKA